MTKIKAKDFALRSDLERFVRNKIDLTPDAKPDYEIVGTTAQLANLQLGSGTNFWGIKCIATDAKPKKSVVAPNRGKIHAFGMNSEKKKLPKKSKKK